MAETQSAPILPPPFPDFSPRRIPHALQLPPLTIPPPQAPRVEFQLSSRPAQPQLPSIHAASAQATAQTLPPPSAPRPAQPRLPSESAAPLANLLSPRPNTPPKSDPTYSPIHDQRRSPPRPFPGPRPPTRHAADRYPPEEPRHLARVAEPTYNSPVETAYRHHPPAIPSPNYTPTYATNANSFRSHTHPHRGSVGGAYGLASHPDAHPPLQAPIQVPPPGLPASSHPPIIDKSPLQYELRVRQQPIAARACGFGERDRRVIDPPPIIQLLVRDPITGTADIDELRYSLNVVHCTLWSADGLTEETALEQPDRRRTRRLMGQLVASPSVAKDEHDVEGCFFCFPDLSCRTHGRYRLRFVLMRLDPANMHVGGFSPILTEVLSDVFTVYTAKDFPGMRPSSALTRALKLQGCNIQVKKGNEKALARKRQSISDAGGEDHGHPPPPPVVDGREDDRPKQRRRKDSAS